MTFEEYLELVNRFSRAVPQYQRLGQVYFNTLDDVRSDLADRVRGIQYLDPFYQNGNIPAFLDFVGRNW